MKTINVLVALAAASVCLFCTGCNDPANWLTVDAGRPFIAQPGMWYGIQENGVKYHFNPGAYSNAQVIYVDPGRHYPLQPGLIYVMLQDPTYSARMQESAEGWDRLNGTFHDYSHSFDGMNKLTDTSEFENSMKETNRNTMETLMMMENARIQQELYNQQKLQDIKNAYKR